MDTASKALGTGSCGGIAGMAAGVAVALGLVRVLRRGIVRACCCGMEDVVFDRHKGGHREHGTRSRHTDFVVIPCTSDARMRGMPLVYHPAYSCPWPSNHRFPMGKFADLHRVLRNLGSGALHSSRSEKEKVSTLVALS